MKVLWHWLTMGPYHFARMEAVARIPGIELSVVETCSEDDHGWQRDHSTDLNLFTLSASLKSTNQCKDTIPSMARVLESVSPEVVVACGYADPHSLRLLSKFRTNNPNSILCLWSESTIQDQPREWLAETAKRLLVSIFDGALVAGKTHQDYLQKLGMASQDIRIVGNCVDNDHFAREADIHRRQRPQQKDFYLYVGRMLKVKNLNTLIDAYSLYRQKAGFGCWDLVLVGSGPEESDLRRQVSQMQLQETVRFEGARQIQELPKYYGHAKCFILPSTSEPWGLVVNEALASGLPVLVSDRVGCASELVSNGRNGFVFNPYDTAQLAELMLKISCGQLNLDALGTESKSIISGYTTDIFADRAASHLSALRGKNADVFRKASLSAMSLAIACWAKVS